MPQEKETLELKEEELEKANGGAGITRNQAESNPGRYVCYVFYFNGGVVEGEGYLTGETNFGMLSEYSTSNCWEAKLTDGKWIPCDKLEMF